MLKPDISMENAVLIDVNKIPIDNLIASLQSAFIKRHIFENIAFIVTNKNICECDIYIMNIIYWTQFNLSIGSFA